MHSLRAPDHHYLDILSLRNFAKRMHAMAFVIAGARGLSSAGDVVFRIVAAVGALEQTNSAALTGLIIVLPGVAGMLCRGRLAAVTRISPVKLLVPMELFRAALFLLLPLFAGWIAVIAVMVVAGGLQAVYESAFAGMLRDRFDRAHMRHINGLVRVAIFCGALASLLVVASLSPSVAEAAWFDGFTFVASAASCAIIASFPTVASAAEEDTEVKAKLASARKQIAIGYFGAAFGLALSAPSIIQICVAALHQIAIRPIAAYAVYEAAVVAGSTLGIVLIVRGSVQLTNRQLLLMLLAINFTMLLGTLGSPVLFLIGVFGSAMAEMIIVVDLISRYQSELPTVQCEEETLWFRSLLAVVACLGFIVNILLQEVLNPIPLLFTVSLVGLGAAAAGFVLTSGLSRSVATK